MKKETVVVAGHSFTLSRERIEAICRDLYPDPVRDHYTVIEGRRFPPKQIIGAITGLDRNDFTTNQARSILRRLGFASGRAGESKPPRAAESAPAYRHSDADALRPYLGRWVATRAGQVVIAADSPQAVLAGLRAAGIKAESLFRVPLDPAADVGGFAS
ncbi:MAG TPA: hypothetical protein VM841_05660 [Actinomycetota bacterium]|nr:hypothetical protein [Actinomycetota bacterium]